MRKPGFQPRAISRRIFAFSEPLAFENLVKFFMPRLSRAAVHEEREQIPQR